MDAEKIKVLYVDDEAHNLTSFRATFRRDYDIFTAESAKEGIEILRNEKIQVIITDQRMPETTGVEFLASIVQEFPEPMRILLTGYSNIEAVIEAINKGKIYYYVSKPWVKDELKVIIDHTFEVYQLREEKKELIRMLKQANEQLEFLLRQKSLS